MARVMVAGQQCSEGNGAVIAVAIWENEREDNTVLARSYNLAIVQALASGSAKHPLLLHLIRYLQLFTARHNIGIRANDVAGTYNIAADACPAVSSQHFAFHPIGAFTHPSGHACPAMPRLDLGQLEDNGSFSINHTLAPLTLQSYKSGPEEILTQFCPLQPWPVRAQLRKEERRPETAIYQVLLVGS